MVILKSIDYSKMRKQRNLITHLKARQPILNSSEVLVKATRFKAEKTAEVLPLTNKRQILLEIIEWPRMAPTGITKTYDTFKAGQILTRGTRVDQGLERSKSLMMWAKTKSGSGSSNIWRAWAPNNQDP